MKLSSCTAVVAGLGLGILWVSAEPSARRLNVSQAATLRGGQQQSPVCAEKAFTTTDACKDKVGTIIIGDAVAQQSCMDATEFDQACQIATKANGMVCQNGGDKCSGKIYQRQVSPATTPWTKPAIDCSIQYTTAKVVKQAEKAIPCVPGMGP